MLAICIITVNTLTKSLFITVYAINFICFPFTF
nr:MAG TPA: hypothetical protein [Caudoviricetes sp.]